MAEEFRAQLTIGVPTDDDEAGLRRLSAQLKADKVVVKLHLRHTLHAKVFLRFRADPNNPVTGFLGSSNLTLSGLSKQRELNVDVLDHDATKKLEQWFNDRWADRWCIDITQELIQIIDESWARPECPAPYQIYVRMAYCLAEDARLGIDQFTIPADMRGALLEFESAAGRIAAKRLEKRGGVILGDVVGLGKTLPRWPGVFDLREAFGVRRVHRRFFPERGCVVLDQPQQTETQGIWKFQPASLWRAAAAGLRHRRAP